MSAGRHSAEKHEFARRRLALAVSMAMPLALAAIDDAHAQAAAPPDIFWDGGDASLHGNNQINGGAGIWTAATTDHSWTNAGGSSSVSWTAGANAVFQTLPGSVTVDQGAGAVSVGGARFLADGYTITGGALTLTTAGTVFQVGNGTSAGATTTATIDSVIEGAGGLKKTDLGTLILSGANTYTAATAITSGTLALASPSSLGANALVNFDGAGSTGGRLLFTSDATLGKRINVVANGSGTLAAAPGTLLTISAPVFTGNGGAGVVNAGGSLSVSGNVAFVGNTTTGTGGAIYSNGTLALNGGPGPTSLAGNIASGNGGAFYSATTRSTSVTGSGGSLNISSNAGAQGGAIYAGSISIDGAFNVISLVGNNATYATATSGNADLSRGGGGTLYAYNSILINNNGPDGAVLAIQSNSSGADGGAMLGHKGITVSGNYVGITVSGNTNNLTAASRGMGGALRVTDGALVVDTVTSGSMTMQNNIAASFGGAMDAAYTNSTMTVLGSYDAITVTDNQSVRDGGGAWGAGNNMLIQTATQGTLEFSRNSSKTSGGALLGYYANMTLSGTYGNILVDSNSVTGTTGTGAAGSWGGAFFTEKALTIDPDVAGDLTFTNNRSGSNGGALASGLTGSVTLAGSSARLILSGNSAANSGLGGAVYTPGALTVSGDHPNLIVRDNSSSVRGGAFYAGTGFNLGLAPGATLVSSGNRATTAGGFLYLQAGNAVFDLGTDAIASIGDNTSLANGTDAISSGAGVPLLKRGAGTLALWGNNNYTGGTSIDEGTLSVNGAVTGPVTVSANATLGGSGTASGAVNILNGGRVAPGSSPGTLTVGALTLASGSQLDYDLGPSGIIGSGVNDLINVVGALTLDGTLNVMDLPGFGTGVYRLINYGGAFTDAGLSIGEVPASFVPGEFQVQTAVTGQVNLVVQTGGFTNRFWDGAQSAANGVVDGGSGNWDDASTNWTGTDGLINGPWSTAFAVFSGAPGTVTLVQDESAQGLQFISDGYRIQSGGQALHGAPALLVRVDDNATATISAPIADGSSATTLTKTDNGTLVLNGTNTFSGGTTIDGGTVQVAVDANLGAASGALTLDGGTLHTTATFASNRSVVLNASGGTFATDNGTTLSLGGNLSGTGGLTKLGEGSLILNVVNSYTGGTNISDGALQVEADDRLGASSGDLRIDRGTLRLASSFALDPSRAVTLGAGGGTIDTQAYDTTVSQAISGPGALLKQGSGSLTLLADNTYLGGTTISAGTLRIGNGGAAGSVTGGIANDGLLVFDRSNTLSYDGSIDGTGRVVQAGTGTTILTGPSSYSGGTLVEAGTLSISTDGNLGRTESGLEIDGGTLRVTAPFNTTRAVTLGPSGATFDIASASDIFTGPFDGPGSLTKVGSGALVLNTTATYVGKTHVAAGSLIIGDSSNPAAHLAGGGDVSIDPGAYFGGYGRATANVDNAGSVGVGNTLPALAGQPDATFTIVGSLTNRGLISLANGEPNDALFVVGNYVSAGGVLTTDVVLNEGGDATQSDRLVASTVTMAGPDTPTVIRGNNVGGTGGITTGNGIPVVNVTNAGASAAGAFVLSGRLVAGPYEYLLFQGGIQDPADGQWYLRDAVAPPSPPNPPGPPSPPAPPQPFSPVVPILRPEVGAYLANRAAATTALVQTMHDRQNDPQYGQMDGSVWVRVLDGSARASAAGDLVDARGNRSLLQFGGDIGHWNLTSANDSLHVGGMLGRSNSGTDIAAEFNPVTARGQTHGNLAGVYATWFADAVQRTGSYIDAWVQYGWFDNDVRSSLLQSVQYDSRTWAASAEYGYAMPVGRRWLIEPQLQVIHLDYHADRVADSVRTEIRLADRSTNVERLGIRLSLTPVSEDAFRPFAEANWWHGDATDSVTFNNVKLSDAVPDNRYQINAGFEGRMGAGWACWARLGYEWAQRDYRQAQAQIGIKLSW